MKVKNIFLRFYFSINFLILIFLSASIVSKYRLLFARQETGILIPNPFVFAQVKYDGVWDPYPDIWPEIMNFLEGTTSVEALPERKIISAIDEKIFDYPVLWLFGRDDFRGFNVRERSFLRSYFDRGGILFIDDSSGDNPDSTFRRKIMEEFAKIFPDKKWERIPESHAIFKSFYLMTKEGARTSGRVIRQDYLEGIATGSRYVVVYSPNDLGGTWQKDRFGNYLQPCIPYQERQRHDSHKLMINFILYSLTGTYKSDAVHQPFIERKLGR